MSLWERWVETCVRRPGTVWGVTLVVLVLSVASATRLRVDTRTESLLPDETPSLRALATLRERARGDAPLELLVASDDPATNRRLAAELRDRVAAWPETRWAIDRRDPSAWLDRRLLYLPAAELESLADQVDDRVAWEECAAMPGCVNFDDQPSLPDEEALEAMLRRVPEVRTLARLFGLDLDAREGRAEPREGAPIGSLCDSHGRVCAVQAALDVDPSDLDRASVILARAEALLDDVRPTDAPTSLRMVVSGRYRNGPKTKASVESDLRATTGLSLVLLVVLLGLQFRGARALVLLVVPIGIGVALTLGVLGAIHPRLNLISAFTLAILSGLGVDFGIHLLTHYGVSRGDGRSPSRAAAGALDHLGKSLVAAGLTTGCAFAALASAEFRGFSEMGWMAALGVLLCLATCLLLFPAIVLLADRVVPERGAWLRRHRPGGPLPPRGPATFVLGLGLAVAVLGGSLAPNVAMEHDLRRLRSEDVGHGIRTSGALHGTTGAVVHLLADGTEALESTARALRSSPELRALASRGAPSVAAAGSADPAENPREAHGELAEPVVLTPGLLLPPDQERRLAAIARLRTTVARVRARHPERDELARVAPWLAVDRPLAPSDLPPWAADVLTERDGRLGRIGLLFVPIRGSDARAMEELTQVLDGWRRTYPEVTFASPEAVLGEIVPGLRADAPRMLGLALLGLVIAVLVLGRSLRRALLVLLPVTLAMAASAGAMVLFDLRVNLFNLLVVPVAFGVGVDGAIYVVWSMEEGPREERWARLRTSARAVLGSTLTTLAAFGSIAIADHPGLASLGHLALVTIALSLVANLVWLPALYRFLERCEPILGSAPTVSDDVSSTHP